LDRVGNYSWPFVGLGISRSVYAPMVDTRRLLLGTILRMLQGGNVMEYDCEVCGHAEYLVLVMSVGDVVCEGCGQWQDAEFNDVWERVS